MKTVAPVRTALGVRTIFNFLGPLTNPAGATRQLIGISDPAYLELMAGALVQLGCRIDYLGNPGYPPLAVHPVPLDTLQLAAPIRVRGDVSSQFLTALLLALPLAAAQRDITIEVIGELISKPYIEITLRHQSPSAIDSFR